MYVCRCSGAVLQFAWVVVSKHHIRLGKFVHHSLAIESQGAYDIELTLPRVLQSRPKSEKVRFLFFCWLSIHMLLVLGSPSINYQST